MRRIAGHGIGWEIAKALCFLLPLATMASARPPSCQAQATSRRLHRARLPPSSGMVCRRSPWALKGQTAAIRSNSTLDGHGWRRRRDLVMFRPSQINFVVPLTAPYGTVNVSVADGLQTIAAGTASVSPTAPAVFTTNASGTGFGAILDGVDFSAPRSPSARRQEVDT